MTSVILTYQFDGIPGWTVPSVDEVQKEEGNREEKEERDTKVWKKTPDIYVSGETQIQ